MGVSLLPVSFFFGWRCDAFVNMDRLSKKIHTRDDCRGGYYGDHLVSSAIGSLLFPPGAFLSIRRSCNRHSDGCEKYVESSRKYGGMNDDRKRI